MIAKNFSCDQAVSVCINIYLILKYVCELLLNQLFLFLIAFLKSSDDSAKFGLKLFEQMNFQLLVVTPLLKISTIEPFISHVGFVTHSDITHRSTLKNIPIEIYKQKRQDWRENNFVNLEQTR